MAWKVTHEAASKMEDVMKRFGKIGMLVALAMMLVGTYRYVSAQETNTLATKHVLQGTIITSGFPALTVPPTGSTPVDAPQTISCGGTTGTCLIQVDHSATTESNTTNNQFALCLVLDGVMVNGCFYTGTTPSDNTPATDYFSENAVVSHGMHTVQTVAESHNGTFVEYFSNTYRVYKP